MAISKKEAKRVAAIVNSYMPKDQRNFLDEVFGAVKSKSFRKSFKKVEKALELPKGKGSMKNAA